MCRGWMINTRSKYKAAEFVVATRLVKLLQQLIPADFLPRPPSGMPPKPSHPHPLASYIAPPATFSVISRTLIQLTYKRVSRVFPFGQNVSQTHVPVHVNVELQSTR